MYAYNISESFFSSWPLTPCLVFSFTFPSPPTSFPFSFRGWHHSEHWEDRAPGGPFSAPAGGGKNNPFRHNRKTHWRRWCKAIFALCSSLSIGEEGTTIANVQYDECAACCRKLYENWWSCMHFPPQVLSRCAGRTLLPLDEGQVRGQIISDTLHAGRHVQNKGESRNSLLNRVQRKDDKTPGELSLRRHSKKS